MHKIIQITKILFKKYLKKRFWMEKQGWLIQSIKKKIILRR